MNDRSDIPIPTDPSDVVIVGGGTAGLLLALILGREGRTVTIIERQTKLRPIARGELLQPNGLRILDRLGLLDRLKRRPVYQAHRFDFHRVGGRKLCSVDYRALPPPWNYTLITQPHHLLGLLLEQLEKTGRIRLMMGTDFDGLLFQNNRIIGIRAVQNGRPIELRTSLVIGSDGAHSRVRQALGIRFHLHAYREGYLTMVVPRPPGFSHNARYYVGRGQILGLFPVSEDDLYLFYMIRAADREAINRHSVATVAVEIAAIENALTDPLKSVTSWDQVGYMPCLRVRAERWTANGAALMGDAAHAMNPHVAQGRNQAMEDAVVLAEVIQEAFRSGTDPGEGFNRYEKERRPPVECLQRMGDELTLLWNTGLAPLAWFRDRIFEGMERHLEVREKVIQTISGLSIRPMGIFDRFRVFLP